MRSIQDKNVIVFDAKRGGHRNGYLQYFSSVLHGREVVGIKVNWLNLLRKSRVLFLSVDDYFFLFIVIALFRFITGKKVVYLTVKGDYCENGGLLKCWLKKKVYLLLASESKFVGVTIIPSGIKGNRYGYFKDWVYDPAFFMQNKCEVQSDICEKVVIDELVSQKKMGKCIIGFYGRVERGRGVEQFLEMAKKRRGDKNLFFVCIGSRAKENNYLSNNLISENLYFKEAVLSERGFDEVFKLTEIVWCGFDKMYDRMSGVFCNGYRNGCSMIIRRDTALYQMCEKYLKCEMNKSRESYLGLGGDYTVFDVIGGCDELGVYNDRVIKKFFGL